MYKLNDKMYTILLQIMQLIHKKLIKLRNNKASTIFQIKQIKYNNLI
jgi:hypothetical protein